MNNSKLRYFIIIFIFLKTAHCFGNNDGFNKGMAAAQNAQQSANQALQTFKPETVFKNYTSNPSETSYVNNPDSMQDAAEDKTKTDPAGQSINHNVQNPPPYHITADSPQIIKIQNQADAVYSVITGQYGDCTEKTSCTTHYETATCQEAPPTTTQYCKAILTVDMIPKQVQTHYTLKTSLSANNHDYAGVVANTVTGVISFLGPSDAHFSLTGRLPNNIDCSTLTSRITAQSGAHLDYIYLPTCSNGLDLNYHMSSGHSINLTIDVVSTTTTYVPEDHWQDECTGLSNNPSCSLESERCLEANTTHTIQGIPVTRDCWEKESTYQCGSKNQVNECQAYRDQACEQTHSECVTTTNNSCTLYEETFRCPKQTCTNTGAICNGTTYCLEGDCAAAQSTADPDFQQSVSSLVAVEDASKSYSDNYQVNYSIFGGEKKSCRKDLVGFADCCSDSGWGMDLNLAQCSQEEKDLGVAKQNLQTVYIGEYCDQDMLGVCLLHKKAYCVFPSKMSRIIQEQGRRDQLGISFGTPEHPDCRGLTDEEFTHLDLGKINFNDFYQDIYQSEQLESADTIDQRVTDSANAQMDGTKS